MDIESSGVTAKAAEYGWPFIAYSSLKSSTLLVGVFITWCILQCRIVHSGVLYWPMSTV